MPETSTNYELPPPRKNPPVPKLVAPEPTKRLNVNLTESEHRYLKQLAQSSRLTMTELIRLAVDIIEDVLEDRPKGHKLVAVNKEGMLVKEYVLPGKRRRSRP